MLHLALNTDKLGKTATDVLNELLETTPRIRLAVEGEDTLTVNVHTLNEGEEHIIAGRLRDILDV